MSEKFHINWNDFQAKVSSSFQTIRDEGQFSDVTLVSDDQVSFPLHKLVLSTSSNLFKTLLVNNPHPNPLLYLHGVNSFMMKHIIDFMYKGQVDIVQDQLDHFLIEAQKFQLEGLMPSADEEIQNSTRTNMYENKISKVENDISFDHDNKEAVNFAEAHETTVKTICKVNKIENREIVGQKVEDMIYFEDGLYKCRFCGKEIKDRSNARKHADTHLEGVAYECHQCNKKFRSKNSLYFHTNKYHSKVTS